MSQLEPDEFNTASSGRAPSFKTSPMLLDLANEFYVRSQQQDTAVGDTPETAGVAAVLDLSAVDANSHRSDDSSSAESDSDDDDGDDESGDGSEWQAEAASAGEEEEEATAAPSVPSSENARASRSPITSFPRPLEAESPKETSPRDSRIEDIAAEALPAAVLSMPAATVHHSDTSSTGNEGGNLAVEDNSSHTQQSDEGQSSLNSTTNERPLPSKVDPSSVDAANVATGGGTESPPSVAADAAPARNPEDDAAADDDDDESSGPSSSAPLEGDKPQLDKPQLDQSSEFAGLVLKSDHATNERCITKTDNVAEEHQPASSVADDALRTSPPAIKVQNTNEDSEDAAPQPPRKQKSRSSSTNRHKRRTPKRVDASCKCVIQ